jgi:signal transduction histidine kinase
MSGAGRLASDARELDALTLVAHELRGSITVLNGYLSMLRDGVPEPVRLRAIDAMRGVVADMDRTVGMLVMASRLRSGLLPHSPSGFDLIEAVGPAVERVRPRAELEGARVEVRPALGRVIAVADRSQVVCILSNLLNNALTYSRGPALVSVVIRPGDPVEVAVRDHGVGVAPEWQHEVFEQFARLDGAAPHDTRGLGLGLFIGRELAALNGGSLTLEWSEPGQGSVFVLRLPAAGAAASA